MRAHIVRDGEYLTKIAALLGTSPEALWNHPANADLKAKRQHMDVLSTGDILYLPDDPPRPGLPLRKGTTTHYAAKVPKATVSITLRDGKIPLKNEPFVVNGAGAPIEGTTDGSGNLTFQISVHIREAEILLPKKGLSFPLHIGDMDPITETSGVQKRLENLGLYSPPSKPEQGTAEEALKAAITSFQKAQDLKVSGEIDDPTRQRLVELYGC